MGWVNRWLESWERAEYESELLRSIHGGVPEVEDGGANRHASVGHFTEYEHDPSLNPTDHGPWWDGEWGPLWPNE